MNTSPSTTRNHRARWAAIGAAVAVSLGAGGIGLVNATTAPEGASAFVPIDPCRILDTRTNQDIGDKTGGFGPSDTHTVQTQSGNTGQCDPLPSGITGVALNVTAVTASELTHLTFWAGDPNSPPNVSSLNPTAGQPPTPNAVTVDVAADGSFNVFNFAGSVQLIIDVLGYYTDHHHDDRIQQITYSGTTSATPAQTSPEELRVLGSFTKSDPDTAVRITWQGHVSAGGVAPVSCAFQVHVDGVNNQGNTLLAGTHVVVSGGQQIPVSSMTVFDGLDAGDHEITLWVRTNQAGNQCSDNPGNYSRSVIVEEFHADVS